jgi:thymidine kinase
MRNSTDIALYPGARGSGKTTFVMRQIRQAATVGQHVGLMVPHASLQRDAHEEIRSWGDDLRPVPVFTESGVQRSRGYRFDHLFIDSADLFEDNPIEMAFYYHPGVPLTVSYTPRKTSA